MHSNHLPLSKNAQKIQQELQKRGMTFSVIELAESTRTAKDAASSIGCAIGQIVKSLIFRFQDSHAPILILASGINQVDEKIIERLVGAKIVKADAGFTRQVTGFGIGGVAPLGHAQRIDITFIDEDLLLYQEVWAAAGSSHAVFALPADQLAVVTGGKIIPLKKENSHA